MSLGFKVEVGFLEAKNLADVITAPHPKEKITPGRALFSIWGDAPSFFCRAAASQPASGVTRLIEELDNDTESGAKDGEIRDTRPCAPVHTLNTRS